MIFLSSLLPWTCTCLDLLLPWTCTCFVVYFFSCWWGRQAGRQAGRQTGRQAEAADRTQCSVLLNWLDLEVRYYYFDLRKAVSKDLFQAQRRVPEENGQIPEQQERLVVQTVLDGRQQKSPKKRVFRHIPLQHKGWPNDPMLMFDPHATGTLGALQSVGLWEGLLLGFWEGLLLGF